MRKLAIVLGLGEVGKPIFNLLTRAYETTQVRTYDPLTVINPPTPGEVFDYMHICFPQTPRFFEYLKEYVILYEPKCIIIHSTLHPGTMMQLAKQYHEFSIDSPAIFYSPVRGNIKDGMEWGLKHYTKFFAGAFDYGPKNAAAIVLHLDQAGIPAKAVDSPKSLEYAKLFNLAYYGSCIAIFQEFERIVEAEDLNYDEIKTFIFSTEGESGGKVRRSFYYGGHIDGHCVIPALEKLVAAHDVDLFKDVILSNIRRERELTLK